MTSRRRFLLTAGLLPFAGVVRAAAQRVVIVGGGWGGLAVARHLRSLAPELEVVLIDRQPTFISFALSNRWLVDGGSATPERQDYAALAGRFGYRFVAGEVNSIDRAARSVQVDGQALPYDWLVLSPGIREDWSAWQITGESVPGTLRQRYGGGMAHAAELAGLRQRLAGFTGGDLVLTIPPAPYRCPPAPYERAMFLAWWLKTQKIPGKLVVIDPNPLMPAFRAALLDRFKDQVSYVSHARVQSVDLARRIISTEVDDFHFDEALLSPPQQAADLIWQAGLIRNEESGRPSGWAGQGGLDFRSPLDARVFIIGDACGLVSPLFGQYPKTGHMAARMGLNVARQIAQQTGGVNLPVAVLDSVCHVATSIEPPEQMRIAARYRARIDGFLMQEVQQTRNPSPAGEDVAWAESLYREFLRP